ncbi:Protein VACUOLELESS GAMETOPHYTES [Cardamine amara subsp. amara]|uniref:Protein VACUOLELESS GAMETOPHYTES n=1 Tax=Cardamine amara subsp. amara TaxID=228776 RepID=A0ABD1BMA6_CARAN
MDPLPNAASCRLLCPKERFEKDKGGKVITVLPKERFEKDKGGKVITVHRKTCHVISSPYWIPDAVHEKSHHLQFVGEGEEGVKYCYSCCQKILEKAYFYCSHCPENYHKECVESPSLFQSSDHPKHPLQLVLLPRDDILYCISCKQDCYGQFYVCLICDFIIHLFCAINPTSLTIDNPKRHEHTLLYIPRKSNMVCDVCGSEKESRYLYACLQCDFMVHKDCVSFPYVIQVSRHSHRLTFTPSIPYKEWTNCGVCQKKINENYGKYSCIKGCAFAVHTRCALRNDVCDGRELEGVSEEVYENTKMFDEEGDGIMRHTSHLTHHQMRLGKMIERVYDEIKQCEMCLLPFVDDSRVYRCLQCDFNLHESCAYLPRVKQFMLHAHPLILKTPTVTRFQCRKCHRYSCGFRYVCDQGCYWKLDTLCASICEPFDHHSHPHSLFITCDQYTLKICSICREENQQPLSCDKCNFVLCFNCATLPHKVRYEHDEHLLTFSYKEEANNEVYCCEICEEDIYPKRNGFYACNECGLAIHIECLLGRDPYLKLGQKFRFGRSEIRILANTWSTRPVCRKCKRRCPYKTKMEFENVIFCSFDCYSTILKKLV